MTTTTIYDTADEFIWESVVKTYDDSGALVEKETVYDNGTFSHVTYLDGQISTITQLDLSSDGTVKPWQEITTKYNENGLIAEKLVRFDNDTITASEYTDGAITKVTQIDESDDGSAKNWSEITTNFDVNGLIADKIIRYDNDTLTASEYTDGTLNKITQIDESNDGLGKNWSEITKNFDANGLIADKVIRYDNDTITASEYTNGTLFRTVQIDESNEGSAKNWSEIYTDYNNDGTIQTRTTMYDDGRIRGELYEDIEDVYGNPIDGKLIYFQDTEDAFNWETKFTVYDENNNRLYQAIGYDNHDLVHLQYAGDDVSVRLDVDGDDTDPWYARERFYDENGNVIETIYYETSSDVPEYYGLGPITEPEPEIY
jgi:hypothetical protein